MDLAYDSKFPLLPKHVPDLTGKFFGRLTVVAFCGSFDWQRYWQTKCSCGRFRVFTTSALTFQGAQSCGCLTTELRRAKSTKHGLSDSRVWRAWKEMKRRCTDHRRRNYSDYGGRGISVCERWNSFDNFLFDMGEPPDGMSIDRINNEGNYEKGNCRWTDRTTQNRNSRNCRLLSFGGQTRCVTEWAEITGLHVGTIRERLKKGLTDEMALGPLLRVRR